MTNFAPPELFVYSAALFAQLISIAIAISAYRHSGNYRYAWGLMGFVLVAMLSRRIINFLTPLEMPIAPFFDAGVALVISLGMMVAMFSLKNIFSDLEKQRITLEALTLTDPLTGALNRSGIISHLEQEFQRADRNCRPIGVLMVDIDHFKEVNDHYGHLAGDAVLSNLIVIFQRSLRGIDSIGRYGGEEFLLVLPDTSADEATIAAERIRSNVENAVLTFVEGEPVKITVSIGIAIYDPPLTRQQNLEFNIREYIRRSDVAMYFAKKSGRNRVTHWNSELVIS